MKRFMIAALALTSISVQAENIRFAYQPSLSPDGKQIYFSYDGDIYRVPVTGGQATAVITMAGEENYPVVSPDGKWLAFSSDIQGNSDVYVVPVNGGNATQLTFHEAADTPVGWSADSKYIYFETTRTSSRKTTFRVGVNGGTPQKMFPGYFNTIVNLVENPKTGEFLFNESMESISFPTRKHYVGDHNPNIKSWNAKTSTYKELTTYNGKDQWPMADKNGNIYYVSDESNGESQVVRYKSGKPEVLTKFDKSVQYPAIAFDGSAIVFLKDYQITVLDPKTKKVSVPEIQVASGAVEVRRSFTGQRVQGGAVSPDGKKFALVIRGELYVSDTKAKFLQKLETPANERVDEVVWAKDSKTIYYTRTNKGWTNIFKIAADQSSAEKSVFTSKNNVKNLTVNHKNDKAVYVDGSRDVYMVDLTNDKTQKICSAEFWSFQGYDFSFSHDDNYIAFNAMNLFESDIYIYDIKAQQLHNLTNSAGVDNNAVFSPDGKNLYLTSNPTSASFPKGSRAYLYKLPLQKYETPFKSDVYDKLFTETKKEDKKDDKKDVKKDEKAEKTTPEIKIDYKDIYKRMTRMERGDNAQSNLFTYSSKGKDYLFYNSGYQDQYVLEISDPEAKPKKIKDGGYGTYSVSTDGIYLGTTNGILKLNPEGASATKIEIKKDVEKVLNDEFTQMFYETWAVMDQNYYDPKFHGANWPAVRDYYASFLPYVRTRANLRTLLTDLLGELNSSHLGFTSNGAEEKTETRIRSYATGIMFQNQAPFTVDYILENSAADKIEIKLQKGDELVAVNGVKVTPSMNREKLFSSAVAMDEAKCTFKRAGKEFTVKLHLQPYSEVKALEYKEWEEQRKNAVEEKTNGRVAYHHMQAMGATDLNDFLLAMHTDAVHKDALILDLRYNNGGNVHKEVIDFLRGENYFTWAHRDFPKNSHPNVAPAGKPIVVLVNEHSLSDAEVTSNGIKTLGIAKLIGTETYRWIIFTSSVRLLDGSTCRMPAWGCYNVKGEDLEHVGVKPDIYVKNNFKDRVENKDPQLDAAIKEIMNQLNGKK